MHKFEEEYKKLNKAQREAVDTIDGPVMVVAGPGTGKTQVLALRIGHILKTTDAKADSILCLTFTKSGVKAMRERLLSYIGAEAMKIKIATFHSFGLDMIEKYYPTLGLSEKPKLIDEKDAIALADDVLLGNAWEYIRPRGDTSRYFRDLKSLISLLKRERITPEDLERDIKKEINNLENDPGSISSRGTTKGELKKEVVKKVESLSRTFEAVKFFDLYEAEKQARNLLDYDDVLESLVQITEESEEARSSMKEEFLYVLIDEHQDSSGIQNEFLTTVWGGEERPNIFVVGDDRQLIYGFGGASLEYFENFKHAFGLAKLITLKENYRSTKNILEISHELLESSITTERLVSNHPENHPIRLVEASYPRDEILAFGFEVKKVLKNKKADPNDIALLVPKNRQVRTALSILRDMGIPVSTTENMNFFDSDVALSFLRVLKVIADPSDGNALAGTLFDKYSNISPLLAHKFIKENYMKEFSLLTALRKEGTLFGGSPVDVWIAKIHSWLNLSASQSVYALVQHIASEFLLDTAENHEELVERVEVVRTVLHLILARMERDPKLDLKKFLEFLDRLESYGEHIPIASFGADVGVKVLTLHGSKGLEFDYVWIAHMDEKSVSGSRHSSFSLPESVREKVEKKDEEVLKRQLYVALTRAKRFCTLSYALKSYEGGDQSLANVASLLLPAFEKQDAEETEKIILAEDPKAYAVGSGKGEKKESVTKKELAVLVAKDYEDRKVSVSLLNNFFECPWKWYFRNLLQLPEPKMESLEFGNVIHGSIDQVLKLGSAPSAKDIEEIVVRQVRKSGFGDERKQKEFIKEGVQIVSTWAEKRLKEIAKDKKNEESVSLIDERYPHLTIYGKIDLLEMLGKTDVRVTDFKTGSPRKKADIEKIDEEGRQSDYMRQLAMYSYLLGERSKWKKNVTESKLEFLQAKTPSEAFYSTNIGQEQIDLLVRDIQDYDKIIKSGKWLDRECHFKSYGKQNASCDYCKMAEIYK